MLLEERMSTLRERFGLSAEDLRVCRAIGANGHIGVGQRGTGLRRTPRGSSVGRSLKPSMSLRLDGLIKGAAVLSAAFIICSRGWFSSFPGR